MNKTFFTAAVLLVLVGCNDDKEQTKPAPGEGKITVTAAIPPNAAAKICLEPGAKLLETDGLTFAEQNGCPTAQVGSGQYRVSYTMEQ